MLNTILDSSEEDTRQMKALNKQEDIINCIFNTDLDKKTSEDLIHISHPINGSMVIGRIKETIFIRLPQILQTPITGGCHCDYCKKEKKKNPLYASKWDTLAISKNAPKKGNDYAWTVHMPEIPIFQ